MPHDLSVLEMRPDVLAQLALLDQVVLDALPLGVYVCDRHGRILRVNARACQLWGRRPQLGDGAELFCGSHKLFTLEGEPVPRDAAPMAIAVREGICFQVAEAVVENPDGKRWIGQVTISVLLDDRGQVAGAINCFRDVTEEHARRESDRRALEESERWHASLLQALPMAIYTTDAEGRITFFNDAAAAFAGRTPVIGEDSWCVSWKLSWPDGTPLAHEDCPMALAIRERRPSLGEYEAVAERPDGGRTPFMPFATPLYNEAGEMTGAVNVLVDISERKRADQHHQVLIDELNHRVKNTLATVQSIAMQTLSDADSLERFKRGYEGRLVALSRAHDLLTSTHWRSAELSTLVTQELEAFGRGRFAVEGPAMSLSPRAAVTLAMILHELATNAVRHGALSAAEGRITVRWTLNGSALDLEWKERGGPRGQPRHKGFGARLLERGVSRDLGGQATVDFGPLGLSCAIRLPADGNIVMAA